jgi:hypothetical protein
MPAAVEATTAGEPKAMLWRGVYKRVAAIHDSWRIDDEWWRDEIARRYFVAELEGGRRVTVYHDLVRDTWYAQSYEAPRAGAALMRGEAAKEREGISRRKKGQLRLLDGHVFGRDSALPATSCKLEQELGELLEELKLLLQDTGLLHGNHHQPRGHEHGLAARGRGGH